MYVDETTTKARRSSPEVAKRRLAPADPSGARGSRTLAWWSPGWVLVADLVALAAVAGLVGRTWSFALCAAASVVLSLRMVHLYGRARLPEALREAGRISVAAAAGSLVAAAVTGTTSAQAITFAIVVTPLLVVARMVAYSARRRAAARRPQPALIVGTGPAGQELITRLLDHPEYGINPVGFVDSDPSPLDPSLPVSVLGSLSALRDVVRDLGVRRVFLDAGSVAEHDFIEVLDLVADLNVEISVLPVLVPRLSTSLAVEGIAGSTLLTYRPSRHQGFSWAVKRALDIAGSLAMLAVSAPICLAAAAAIKLDSSGPVLFKQVRVGRNGRPFMIYKFRSMETDAEARKTLYLDLNASDGPYFKLEHDPRVTRVGRLIRRYSIDEIPQLLNVLRGEMSLVGPRPALESEVAEYPAWFRRRLAVRPGLSGLWQVSGRFLVPFAEATRLDVTYVDNWSLGLDLQILARTPGVVLSGRGAR